MLNKSFKGLIFSSALVILPALGNAQILRHPHLWILFVLGILASIFQPDYRIGEAEENNYDKGTELQIVWSVFITQLTIVLEAAYCRFPESVRWDVLSATALVSMILGLSLRTWAVCTLGPLFTMHLAVRKEHRVIHSGPYRFLRHPSYVGAFLIYAATGVFLHSRYLFIIVMAVMSIAWLRRIHWEEKMLLGKLGEEYKSYSQRVKRILPGVW